MLHEEQPLTPTEHVPVELEAGPIGTHIPIESEYPLLQMVQLVADEHEVQPGAQIGLIGDELGMQVPDDM
jgi:hypothetical protein